MEIATAITTTSEGGKGIFWLWSKVIKPFLTARRRREKELYSTVKEMSQHVAEMKKELSFNGGNSIKDVVCQARDGIVELSNRVHHLSSEQEIARNLQGMAFWIADEQGQWVKVSPNLCGLTGWSETELSLNAWITRVTLADRQRVWDEYHFALENKVPFDSKFDMIKKSGGTVSVMALMFHKRINGAYNGTMGKLESATS